MLGLFEQLPALAVAVCLGFVAGITIHEAAHAWSAYMLGDDTAYRAGRVTLNPVSHLDVLGTVMLFLVGFGWGKPTPVMPSNLKWGKLGAVAVAFAGPLSNLLVVFICAALYLLPQFQAGYLQLVVVGVAFVNALLFVFNLIPIPPLDGSKVIFPFLPRILDGFVDFMNQYGPFILLGLVLLTWLPGVASPLSYVLLPILPLLIFLGLPLPPF